MRTLVINFKNYQEVLGNGSVILAKAAEKVARKVDVRVVVAPPTPLLGLVASSVRLPVFSQGVSGQTGEKTTGSVLPESVKAAGAAGTILNHSESKMKPTELRELVPRVTRLSMEVCLCAGTADEARRLSGLKPASMAVEPPGLIGSGIAVSKAKPELVRRTVSTLREGGFRGSILCGAGIVSGEDVRKAAELGSDGVLVSSSVVKAKDWEAKISELARSLI